MRLPTKKTLSELSVDHAKTIRWILNECGGDFYHRVDSGDISDDYPQTQLQSRQLFNPWSRHEYAMQVINELLGTFGVEAIWSERDSCKPYPNMEYLNTGDTYDATLVYDFDREIFQVISWGDWLERAERRGLRFT